MASDQDLSPQELKAKNYEKREARGKRIRERRQFSSLVINMTGKFLWEVILVGACYYTFLGVIKVSIFDVLQGKVLGFESVAYSINVTIFITAVVFLIFSALTWPRAYGEYAAFKKNNKQRMAWWLPFFSLILGLLLIAILIVASYFIVDYIRPDWVVTVREFFTTSFPDSVIIKWYSR